MARPRILAIDDEEAFLISVETVLGDRYEISQAVTATQGLALLRSESFNAVLLDIVLPDIDGLTLLKSIVEIDPVIPVLMLTGESKSDKVVQAVKSGAYDYLTKPVDRDRLITSVGNAIKWEASERERRSFIQAGKDQYPIIGKSRGLEDVVEKIHNYASSDFPVLITGETGVGKEIVARHLHWESKRAARPFVKINVPAIQETLLESELFGRMKGAFTGADRDQEGLISRANGGTVFLDEIGYASVAVQVKLLQVVEQGTFTPVGGTKETKVDVRFVAATNKDLEDEIKKEKFREDLFGRLNMLSIEVPPLRERKPDIPGLLGYYMAKSAAKSGNPQKNISTEALTLLLEYSWPRNVRELIAFVERAMLLVDHDVILPADVMMCLGKSAAGTLAVAPSGLEDALFAREHELIQTALIMNGFSVAKAAESLKIHRSTLYEKLKTHGIKVEGLSPNGDETH